MHSESTILERELIARFRSGGPITFRDFMQAALYDPARGYYNTARLKIGPAGDYYTSSNIHSIFGALLARAFVELWHSVSSHEPLALIEIGAGTGQLAADILAALRDEHPTIFDRSNYSIIEISPAMRSLQEEKLIAFRDRVLWRDMHEFEGNPIRGVVFSNELVDAMPVHRVRFRSGRLEELYVTVARERLAFAWESPSTPKLAEYISRMGARPAHGQIIEINLDAVGWLAQASHAIESGFLVTIDYGDTASHLWGPGRPAGTIRSFYKHRLVDSPLERVGKQDITASVNFSALIEWGRDFGFETMSFERQTAFLMRMGLLERIAAMENAEGGAMDDLKERLAIKILFVPGGISDNFRVLVQRKVW
ncbi:MAG: SAM-dependent methyltransferase [Blastocatellia bacterium]|nr:SAM-dependent methyltransferase [Blastocatellia bacterium]